MLFLKHSLNIIILPTRPFPSPNGCILSNLKWKSTISSKVILVLELYSFNNTSISFSTSSGAVVLITLTTPIILGTTLNPPTLYLGFS